MTGHAKGVFPESHPQYVGIVGVGQHPSVAILSIVSWQWMPFMMLVLLTGLQSLPQLLEKQP